jgi:hypothetical protein
MPWRVYTKRKKANLTGGLLGFALWEAVGAKAPAQDVEARSGWFLFPERPIQQIQGSTGLCIELLTDVNPGPHGPELCALPGVRPSGSAWTQACDVHSGSTSSCKFPA